MCGTLQNFIGRDGVKVIPSKNRNVFRKGEAVQGLFMKSETAPSDAEQWGTMALTVPLAEDATYRTSLARSGLGHVASRFLGRFQGRRPPLRARSRRRRAQGLARRPGPHPGPRGARVSILHNLEFPEPHGLGGQAPAQLLRARLSAGLGRRRQDGPRLPALEAETVAFVAAFLESDLPKVVKESALFNLSTLRSQTCFRTEDGKFYAWEGCGDKDGCCWGSCTHVWNYEQSMAFLFGELSRSMRAVEFGSQTDDHGLMSFRVKLPLTEERWGKAAADGQMGCILKMYRDWQLSGDATFLKTLWPRVKKALEFCWIPGGWDADKDGVMEGCQHNTMDVEYYGPNPQMGLWYLGALRAAEEMARGAGDAAFAKTCRALFENGSRWIDANLFNGRYYIHKVVPPKRKEDIAPPLLVGMGAADVANPDYQLANGCLVDQLVGQAMAHVCGLGYLVKPENARTTLASIVRYNRMDSMRDHFNCLRTFALGDEAASAHGRLPRWAAGQSLPYFTEVMTGFEYAAAVGMLYEGMTAEGLRSIADVRARYDGLKRSPYDEAECGHHYGRAMIAWAEALALTGFHYSGVAQSLEMAAKDGRFFWSNGQAYGTAVLKKTGDRLAVTVRALKGEIAFKTFTAAGFAAKSFPRLQTVKPGAEATFELWAKK